MITGPFHLAIVVDDLAAAEGFYAGTLGAAVVARDAAWIVFDFFGHKLTVNLAGAADGYGVAPDDIAIRHFGVILDPAAFHTVNDRLLGAGAAIVRPATLQGDGTPRAQWVLFVKDPSGNGLEFNAFPGGTWQAPLAP